MRHWPFFVVLLFASLLRVGVAIAYRPALFFSDSWSYLDLAYRHAVVGISPARPSGYSLILHALAVGGPDLLTVTSSSTWRELRSACSCTSFFSGFATRSRS